MKSQIQDIRKKIFRLSLLSFGLLVFPKTSMAQIQWTNVVSLSINGQTLVKNTNSQTAWNSGAISQQNFYGDGWIEFQFLEPKYALMGLATYNNSVSPSLTNYAIYVHINGYLYIYEKGVAIPNVGKSKAIQIPFSRTDFLRVERTNGIIYYKRNGITFYTSTVPSAEPLHADCSFNLYMSAIKFTNFMFGLVWTGELNADWNLPGNWSLNRIPAAGDQVIINTCSTCPILNSPVTVGALQINDGGSLDLNSATITVGGPTILNGCKIYGDLAQIVSSDFLQIKNSIFEGTVTLKKTGGSSNVNHGGNTFSPELKIVNLSAHSWQIANQSGNVIKDH